MNPKELVRFNRHVTEVWEALKFNMASEHWPLLRRTLLAIIAEEDTDFTEFVDLMRVSEWDPKAAAINWFEGKKIVAKTPKKSKTKKTGKINKELHDAWAKTEPAPPDDDISITKCMKCHRLTMDFVTTHIGLCCQDCADVVKKEVEPDLYQCHYCGDMYQIKDLTGAKEGLICYKCRQELETRDADVPT
jgi:hypothetical protein